MRLQSRSVSPASKSSTVLRFRHPDSDFVAFEIRTRPAGLQLCRSRLPSLTQKSLAKIEVPVHIFLLLPFWSWLPFWTWAHRWLGFLTRGGNFWTPGVKPNHPSNQRYRQSQFQLDQGYVYRGCGTAPTPRFRNDAWVPHWTRRQIFKHFSRQRVAFAWTSKVMLCHKIIYQIKTFYWVCSSNLSNDNMYCFCLNS